MHAYKKHLNKCKHKGGARIDALLETDSYRNGLATWLSIYESMHKNYSPPAANIGTSFPLMIFTKIQLRRFLYNNFQQNQP